MSSLSCITRALSARFRFPWAWRNSCTSSLILRASATTPGCLGTPFFTSGLAAAAGLAAAGSGAACASILLATLRAALTAAPLSAWAEGAAAAAYLVPVPAEAGSFEMPTSAFDRHVFLQQALDGRLDAAVVNRAVLESLGVPVVTSGAALAYDTRSLPGEVAGCGAVPDFVGDDSAAEGLDSILAARLREENKREEDLEPYLEALVGEGALAAMAGDPGFVRRRLCVTWLLFSAT
uniref:Uncharacterized protein n=1 Tax=Cryptomonas curvata TaxID=233186 RepID=A0A7S0MXU3_9CRYP|mmetsp:Transcript_571/g.1223  ORF Transcript_571/g.1223 Transcript_571/m.1223 type:complete len:236 (+) Transcript_571:254-961(+)